MRVLAYDPGVSTGWVIGDTTPDGQDIDVEHFGQEVYDHHVKVANRLTDLINEHRPDILVAERFDLRPGNKFVADLTPVQVNAIMDSRYPCAVVYQTPSQAKSLITDKALKRLGFWPTGKHVGYKDANDVRDAARHLFRYALMVMHLPGTAARMTD